MITKDKILEKFQDLAGKWRVVVDLGNGEARMLKFHHDPELSLINKEINKLTPVVDKQAEIAIIDQQIMELQTKKSLLEVK